MDSKQIYPWMRHAAAGDSGFENKVVFGKDPTTRACELSESAHATNTTLLRCFSKLWICCCRWSGGKGDAQAEPGCTAAEDEARAARSDPAEPTWNSKFIPAGRGGEFGSVLQRLV